MDHDPSHRATRLKPHAAGLLRARWAGLLDGLAVAVSLGIVVLVARCAGSGLELSDESFYLLASRSPERVEVVNSFGFYTGLLYRAAAGDLGTFRALGLAAAMAGGGALSWVLGRRAPSRSAARPRLEAVAGSAVLGSVALAYALHAWILTPNYNWLTLVGLTLGFSGLAWLLPAQTRDATWGCGAWGVGIGLAFMGKPPAGALLGAGGAAWILLRLRAEPADRRRSWVRPVLLGVTAGGGAVVAFHALGFQTPARWWEALSYARAQMGSLGGHQGLGARTAEHYTAFLRALLGQGALGWLLAGAALTWLRRRRSASPGRLEVLACGLFGIGGLLGVAVGANQAVQLQSGPWVWSLSLGAIACAVGAGRLRVGRGSRWSAARGGLSLLLASGALMAHFGSSNSLEWMSGLFLLFPVAATTLLLRRTGGPLPALYRVAIVGWLAHVSLAAAAQPYRLPAPVWQQTVRIGGGASSLQVDEATARFVGDLRAAAERGGFQRGTLLIDLTGSTPGAAYLLEAGVLPSPWLLGYYPGSNDFARRALARAGPEDRARAWLLTTSAEDPGGVSPAVLDAIGRTLADYEPAASLAPVHSHQGLRTLWRPRPAPR